MQLVKDTRNILYTFWGQKEIETDICPGETFNDSCCTSVDKSIFRVLHIGEKLYYKKHEMTQVDIKRFLFVEFKESHLKNEPIRRKEPT